MKRQSKSRHVSFKVIYFFTLKYVFRKALQFYRGKDYDITAEIEEIQEKSRSKKQNMKSNSGLKRLCSKAFFRPFTVAGVLSVGSIMAGFNVTTIYMIVILREAGSTIDPNIAPIIFGALRVFVGGKFHCFFLKY